MKNIILGVFSAVLLTAVCGCSSIMNDTANIPPAVVVKAAPGEIVFDGKINEKFWQQVPAHELVRCDETPLLPPKERDRILQDKLEKCLVKFAYDAEYLYIAAAVEDNDFIAVTPPEAPAVIIGDRLQISLVPDNASHYWDFLVAPNGTAPAFFYDMQGFYLSWRDKKQYGKIPGYAAKVQLNGTLNKQSGRDKNWTTEIRIPLKALNYNGIAFAPGEKWRILVGRYNFSSYNYSVQTSAYPELPAFNFNLRKYFAPVSFR